MAPLPTFEPKKVLSLFAVLTYAGLILAALWLLYSLRSLIPPFAIATIIAVTLTPEVDRMERRGYRRWAAIGIIYLAFLAVSGAILMILIPLVSGQVTDLIMKLIPSELLHGRPQDISEVAGKWMNKLHVPNMIRPTLLNQAARLPELLGQGLQWFSANVPAWAASLVWLVIVPIITFFMLLDFHKILGKILILVPQERRKPILKVLTDVMVLFGSYVRGMLSVMLLDIFVISIVLNVAGLGEYAWTLAAIAGILYTIPYFGAVVSTLLIGLVTLATHGPAAAIAMTLVMILIHQVIFDNVVAPRIIGGSVNLHPLLTLISLMAGGILFGIGGTLLAVPIAAAAQVIIVHLFPQFRTDQATALRDEADVKTTLAADIADSTAARKSRIKGLRENGEDLHLAEDIEQPLLLPDAEDA